eukprot:Em0010g569a
MSKEEHRMIFEKFCRERTKKFELLNCAELELTDVLCLPVKAKIDLIDMRHMPDGSYHYIAHYMDHWSKFHILWPLMKKSAVDVAVGLVKRVFPYLGLPKILQSDNGREYVNEIVKEVVRSWPGEVVIINGRPRHSQSQGLVEKGNHLVEMQIQSMKNEWKESGDVPWSDWLARIQYNLNTQVCRTLKKCPYEVVFGQPPRTTPFAEFPKGKNPCIMEEDVADLIATALPSSPLCHQSPAQSPNSDIQVSATAQIELAHTRPADILIAGWDRGKPAALDLTITSPLCSVILGESCYQAGAAALAAETRKLHSNGPKCQELGWSCIPLAVETYGNWGKQAHDTFSRLASFLAIHQSSPKAVVVAEIYGRLNVVLVRSIARAILARELPPS